MTRRDIREQLVKLLYMRDFYEYSEINEQNDLYFEVFTDYSEAEKSMITDRYNKIIEKLGEIDQILTKATTGWKLNRLGKIELNLLRIATYEIIFDDTVPAKAAINEAVELAKLYGGEDNSYGFINGILAKVLDSSKMS